MMEGRERIRAEAMEYFTTHGMELVRQTMLKQETTFKEQLRELHRLYDLQSRLMDEMKSSSTVCTRAVPFYCSPNFMPTEIRGGGTSKGCSNGLPFYTSRLKLKRDDHDQKTQGCGHEDIMSIDAHTDAPEDPTRNVNSSGQKATKRTFDLERLPEECLDDEFEASTLVHRIEVRKTNNSINQKLPGDTRPESMFFLSSKEETNSTAFVSPSQRDSGKLHVEHRSFSKQSRYKEDERFPVANVINQCLTPLAPSPHQLSGAKLEKDSDKGGRCNFDDSYSSGNWKKGSVPLNFDTEDIPREIRKLGWETQGYLNKASSVQQKSFQGLLYKNAYLTNQSEAAGGEGKQAGQTRWKSFESPKEISMHSSGQMLGCFKTKAPTTVGQPFSDATNYKNHLPQEKFDSTSRTTMPFQHWREDDLAVRCLAADLKAGGHRLVIHSGSSSEAKLLSTPGQVRHRPHSMDSRTIPASGAGCPDEAISGLWSHFPLLQQHQSITSQQISPSMQGSWQKSGLVSSNGMHSPSSNFLPDLKGPASSKLLASGFRKCTDDLGMKFRLAASSGPTIPIIPVPPSQLPSFNNPLKLMLDGATMQLKLASSESIKDIEIVQLKIPGSLEVEHFDRAPRNTSEISPTFIDRNIGQCSDLGCKEALHVRANFSEDGCLGACEEMGNLVASTDNSVFHTVPVSSGANLRLKIARSASEITSTTEKSSIICERVEVSNIADLIPLKTLTKDREQDSFSDIKQSYPHCHKNFEKRDGKITTKVGFIQGTNANLHCVESEVITPLVAGEMLATMQDHKRNVVHSMCISTIKATDRNFFLDVESMRSEVAKKRELLQGDEISSVQQQAGDAVEDPAIKAVEYQSILETSTATEKPKKPQGCGTVTSLLIQENASPYVFGRSQWEGDIVLTNAEESLQPTRPEEDMASGSTVTKVSSLSPKILYASNTCKGGNMQIRVLDLVAEAENSKPLEVPKEKAMLCSTEDCIGMQTILNHCSTLTSTAPNDKMSLLQSSTNVVENLDPDARFSSKLKHEYPPAKASASSKLSLEETSECSQSLSLDESANLAASILVSILPNASLPLKMLRKKRACSTLPKSSISSANPMLNQGDLKSYSSIQSFFVSPVTLKEDECCTLQTLSLEQVAITEEQESVQWQRPDFDSSSYNMRRCNNISHLQQTNHLNSSFSQKTAGASIMKKKPTKKSHKLKDFSCVSSPETSKSRSVDTLEDEDVYPNKNLVRHGSVVGSTSYTTFEGEGSNQVMGQQVAKPVGLEIPDEDLCSPTHSQPDYSEDETSILPSRDICIRNWGDSTRKRRMQRHKNPAFHKRQKSQRISLSKLSS